MTLTIPQDYHRLPEFIKLRNIVLEPQATFFFISLWVELAYQAPNGAIGELLKSDFDLFYDCLPVKGGTSRESLAQAYLESGCMVVLEENPNAYYSPTFFRFNRDLSRNYRAPGVRAEEAMTIGQLRNRFQKNVIRDVTQIPEEYFKEPVDGKEMTKDEKNRAIVLIRVLDAIFGHRERQPHHFTIGTIQDACRMCRRFPPESKMLQVVINRVMVRRQSPLIPRHTNTFLSNLDLALARLTPDEGWVEWGKEILRAKEQPKT